MNEYSITINEGPLSAEDNAIYFTPEITRVIEYLNDEERPNEAQTFATFVPSNGRQKGQLHKVPWERVVKITELD
jgi:hypothetical protein